MTILHVHSRSKTDHHHHEHAPSWSIAVSMRCFQCSRSWVYFHAELRPRLRGWRSASRVLVRTSGWASPILGLGSPLMESSSALVMSSDVSILARCPKNWSRLAWMNWDSWGGEPAWSLTVALVTWSVYGMRKIWHKHIVKGIHLVL